MCPGDRTGQEKLEDGAVLRLQVMREGRPGTGCGLAGIQGTRGCCQSGDVKAWSRSGLLGVKR